MTSPKPFVEPTQDPLAHQLSEAINASVEDRDELAPEGWTYEEGTLYDFVQDPVVLDAFRVGAKYLRSTTFGGDLYKTFKAMQGKRELQTFIQEDLHGYLRKFEGKHLARLVTYYLSPDGIEDGAWLHEGTWRSEDGKYVAYTFACPSFRSHDGWMWFQQADTGRGTAIAHDAL